MATLGAGVRPKASKNCWMALRPEAVGPCTGYSQPLVLYQFCTPPASKTLAASLGLALAFSATCLGERAPANGPEPGNGLTGTSQRTRIVTGAPPLESMTSLPSCGLLLARSLAPRT